MIEWLCVGNHPNLDFFDYYRSFQLARRLFVKLRRWVNLLSLDKLSEITLIDETQDDEFDVEGTLADSRCDLQESMAKLHATNIFWDENLTNKVCLKKLNRFLMSGSQYMVPHFLNHYDFEGVSDYRLLNIKISYLSLQLGTNVGIIDTGSDETMKLYWKPVLRYNCYVGWANHLSQSMRSQFGDERNPNDRDSGIPSTTVVNSKLLKQMEFRK